MVEKSCAFVLQNDAVLSFLHPLAGRQFVKGGIEPGEHPTAAARRELSEEAGLTKLGAAATLGRIRPAPHGPIWHLVLFRTGGLPNRWTHDTMDDGGHRFTLFWQPLTVPLGAGWHPIYHKVYAHLRRRLARKASPRRGATKR